MNWLQKQAGSSYQGTLYHGSNKSFDSIDLYFAGLRDWGDYGLGVYLSTTSGLAKMYAEAATQRNGGKQTIHVVKANLRNVASFDELMEGIRSNSPLEKEILPGEPQTRPEADSRGITKHMMEMGFDSAMVGKQVVVYDLSCLEIVKQLSPEEVLL